MKARSTLGLLLLLSCLCSAAEFRQAKVLEMRDASEVGANTVADSSEGIVTLPTAGTPGFVPAMLSRCRLTIAVDNTSYSAIFPVNKHLRVTDFNPGDFISARIDGSHMIIKTLDGKQVKAKIVSREAIAPAAAQKPAAGPGK